MRPAIDQLRIEHPTATEGCLKSFYSYEVKGHRFPTEHHRECLRTEQLEQLNSRLDAIEAALTGMGPKELNNPCLRAAGPGPQALEPAAVSLIKGPLS